VESFNQFELARVRFEFCLARRCGRGGWRRWRGGAEGKEGDESVVISAEYLEVAAMATEPTFDVNTTRCSDGNQPILFAVGASSWEAPAHEDCLVLVLGLPGVDVNLQDEQHGNTALRYASNKGAWRCVKVLLADHRRIDVNLPNKYGLGRPFMELSPLATSSASSCCFKRRGSRSTRWT
jgi:hypothetical protein